MKFTRHEIFKLEVLVSLKIDELRERSIRLKSTRYTKDIIKKSIKEYEELEKKLNVLYKQAVLDEVKNSTRD